MPVERAADDPSFEAAGSRITSLAAPSRGADECILFGVDIPAGGGLPKFIREDGETSIPAWGE